MQLQQIYFEQDPGQDTNWILGPFDIEPAMLLVGRNASGKSRTLAILWNFAAIIQGKHQLAPGSWKITFRDNDSIIQYELSCGEGIVLSEMLLIDGKIKLLRNQDGAGNIDVVGSDKVSTLPFQVPTQSVAAAAKRDLLQHPFLEKLHQWTSSLRYYPFGSDMGRQKLAILIKEAPPTDPSDWEKTIGLYIRGKKEFGDKFKDAVMSCLARLDYNIEDIGLKPVPLATSTSDQPLPGPIMCLAVKERELKCWTLQVDMSQGMFRALALMIHLTYAEFASQPSCILLDDVGEGLDYERSTQVIQLLLELSQASKTQIIMATNDRFVMNAVPLEHWAIIRRTGSNCQILTYRNSQSMFEEFKLTGLSNFDLLRSGFIDEQPISAQ